MHIFSKLKESLIQFWRPKFIYPLLRKSTSVMPEWTTQSMERSKSSAKQDQEHVACIYSFHPFLYLVSSVHLRTVSHVHPRMARVDSREKITSGIEREINVSIARWRQCSTVRVSDLLSSLTRSRQSCICSLFSACLISGNKCIYKLFW